MNSPTLIKNIGIGILVIVVIAGAYIFLVRDHTEEEQLLIKDTAAPGVGGELSPQLNTGTASAYSQELREITLVLNQLKSVTIDMALFTDLAFRSLTDFHVEIPLQPQGRQNPFLPGEGIKTGVPTGR